MLSAIGEPLRAEIDLSVSPEELDSVSPRLAAIEDYAAAGLNYNAALNGARLVVKYRENGRRVIDLVTTRPVNEPVIALIVELNMRGGRTARAYNVLLGSVPDAPVRAAAPAAVASVAPAAATDRSAPAVKRTPEAKSVAPAVSRTEKTRTPALAPQARAAAPVDDAAYDRELKRLASQMDAGDKILKDMLSRVTVIEGQVAQLQKAYAALPTPKPAAEPVVSGKPADKPLAEKPVVAAVVDKPAEPAAADPAKPAAAPVMQEVQGQTTTRIDTVPRMPHKSNYMLNEALLVLAGGALALFIGLGYVMLGRRRAAKIAEAEAAIAAEARNAA